MATEHLFPGVFVEELPAGVTPIEGVPTAVTAFVGRCTSGPVNQPMLLASDFEFEQVFGGLRLDLPLGYAVRDFFRNGGSQALILRLVADAGGDAPLSEADYLGAAELQTGLFALDAGSPFKLLCIPPDTRASDTVAGVWQAALACACAHQAILLVDPPAAWRSAGDAAGGLVTLGLAGESARNAALYFPRLLQDDPLLGDQAVAFPPCGAVAGVIARTDAAQGVWHAPAGTSAQLLGLHGLSVALDEAASAALNAVGINSLRGFRSAAWVVWGARTLRGSDAFGDTYKYLPVRRLALFIEASVQRGSQWVVFEPNEEALWARLRLSIAAFMHGLFRQGAFQGATPQQAYFVHCDASTTTPADIAQGLVNVSIGFAPLRPAEFVLLTLQLSAAVPST